MKPQATLSKKIAVMGNQLVDHVERLVAEGNVRRLVVRKPSGKTLFQVPLTTGVAVGSVFVIMAPMLTALSALGALYAQVKLEVVHSGRPRRRR